MRVLCIGARLSIYGYIRYTSLVMLLQQNKDSLIPKKIALYLRCKLIPFPIEFFSANFSNIWHQQTRKASNDTSWQWLLQYAVGNCPKDDGTIALEAKLI